MQAQGFLDLFFDAAPHLDFFSSSTLKWHLQGGPGSVRFGYGLGMERFERFRFSVPAVPLRRGLLSVFQYSLKERTVPVSVPGNLNGSGGSGSAFGSWENAGNSNPWTNASVGGNF